MINTDVVYKIKLTGLCDKDNKCSLWNKDSWVKGVNVSPKVGGSGKVWTNQKLVNKTLNAIKALPNYGRDYTVEVITFNLVPKLGGTL